MDVFSVFPNAVVFGVWELGEMTRSTEVGKVFSDSPTTCDVIIDEEDEAILDTSPNAEYRESSTLIYAKPDQLPTLDAGALQGGYLWHNTETGAFYEIRRCGIGKNQETGTVEHVEFELHQTELDDE